MDEFSKPSMVLKIITQIPFGKCILKFHDDVSFSLWTGFFFPQLCDIKHLTNFSQKKIKSIKFTIGKP